MEHSYVLTLTILKLVTVAFGLVFLYYAWRAYRKHRARSMLVLFVAVALMVGAAVAEGTALQVVGLDLDQAHVVEAVVTLAAFIVLVYSVTSHRVHRSPRTDLAVGEGDEGMGEEDGSGADASDDPVSRP